jgi:hypothetical protein
MVVAANGDLIQTLHKMFAATTSSIECTTGLEGLTIFPKGGLSILTPASAEIILKNIPLIRQESFSLTPQRSVDGFEMVPEDEEKKEKSTLPLLLPLFAVLLIILGVVYVKSTEPIPPTTQKKTGTPTLAPTSAVVNKSIVTIKLTTVKSTTNISEKVKNQLKSAGYTTITEDSITSSPDGRSFVIYSSTINAATKVTIHSILKNNIPTIVEDPSRESSYDVIIVIGK